MTGATSMVATSAPPSVRSAAGSAGKLVGRHLHQLADPAILAPDVATPDVAAQLALVLSAAAAGGLSEVDSEHALRVVEAVEAVKAWADSVSVAATAVMVALWPNSVRTWPPTCCYADGSRTTRRSPSSARHRRLSSTSWSACPTSRFWDSDQLVDGTLRWTMATGRTVTTYPHVYDHPDNTPIDVSNLEARIGRRVARVINPDIPLPGHINILDRIGWAQDLAPVTPKPRAHQWPPEPTKAQIADQRRHAVGPPPF